ncbi:TrbI/VirB10 family protein [Mycobacterium sp. KBS0706]|uniref:TrbI/VirB10 family protein n=1 Tax=Mycobacterium sp. KBS0706 TaxID=2578109 RepID=UPI00110FEBA3|nr:TrbI/VirB10 family protein [Mycobacterium sp. KBS0706]TSD83004.1 TrbI/VirB10 family protein [Mycobacterium sp. KBS0706]
MSGTPREPMPKLPPEALVLRARPRRAVRFRRRLVIVLAALFCAAVFGAAWLALEGRSWRPGREPPAEFGRKATPDGLLALPDSYDQIPKPVPQLGPPLPGDLGMPVIEREKALGVAPPAQGLRPDPEADASRAERLRLAQQGRQAREAGVFFRISNEAENEEGRPAGGGEAQSTTGSKRLGPGLAPQLGAQQRKLDFLNAPAEEQIYNAHTLQRQISPYQVIAGTVIAASLLTGLDSDLPGLVTAQVTENVHDSVTGRVLLIPQGAKLIGRYDSDIAHGQNRVLLAWQRLVLPNGRSIVLDNLPATDLAGRAGLEDEVDVHGWELLKGVVLSTLLGIGTELTFGDDEDDLVRALRQSTQQSANQAGQRITERALDIQPTLKVRAGWPLRVIVHKDLVLEPYQG